LKRTNLNTKQHDRLVGTFRVTHTLEQPYPRLDGTQPCNGSDPELFFDGSYTAPGMCAGCPFKLACAEWGIAHEEYGTWGGLTAADRWRVRVDRQQGLLFRTIDDPGPPKMFNDNYQDDAEMGFAA
jgi:hypothetical protein